MKKIIAPFIRYAIKKAKRSRLIQNLFEAPFELGKYPRFGEFPDAFGNTFELLAGLRDKIKPGWQNMLNPKPVVISDRYIDQLRNDALLTIDRILPVFETFDFNPKNKKILEFGCHSGAVSYALAALGAESVTGTEFSGYKVRAVETSPISENSITEVNKTLNAIREKLRILFNNQQNVKFADDDICDSGLASDTFDLICSWEVLEHLHDPQKALISIARLLKPGGISIHEYNPFFCLNGGHSLCTLDFLWGHVRLNGTDFERYITQIRPQEKEKALSFYQEGLNRMSIAGLKECISNAGLILETILPYIKEQHVRMVNKDVLTQCRQNYPNASFIDLVAPRILIVLRKSN